MIRPHMEMKSAAAIGPHDRSLKYLLESSSRNETWSFLGQGKKAFYVCMKKNGNGIYALCILKHELKYAWNTRLLSKLKLSFQKTSTWVIEINLEVFILI